MEGKWSFSLLGVAVGGLVTAASPAGAKVPFLPAAAQAVQSPAITFDGCVDALGVPVVSVRDVTVDNVAVARRLPDGTPIIQYNPNVLATFRPETRLFWYAHECGHHVLGHPLGNNPLTREKEADCWAVRTLVEADMIDGADLRVIMRDISRLSGDGWIYLPGPQRAMLLEACGSEVDDDDGGDDAEVCAQVRVDCEHAAHPSGDLVPCTHRAHAADVVPCSHACFNYYYGAQPCHRADTVPCTHPAHPADTVPCQHHAHPAGHTTCI